MSQTVTQIPFLKFQTDIIPDETQTHTDVLFSGVRELVLSAAVIGLLDPWVCPQGFDSRDVRLVEAIDLLNVHLLHEHGIRLEIRQKGVIKSRDTAVRGRRQGKQKHTQVTHFLKFTADDI